MNNLQKQIERLKVGKSFTVETDSDRKRALEIGRARGLVLTSRPTKKGGFRITRLMND